MNKGNKKISQSGFRLVKYSKYVLLNFGCTQTQVNNFESKGDKLFSSVDMMTSSNGTFSALLVLGQGNPPVTGGFPSQRPVTRSFDVFFYLRLEKRLSKQLRRRWFETPSRPLWRHYDKTRQDSNPGTSGTHSPANRMAANKSTDLPRFKLKKWTWQPVPMMN